MRYGFKAELKRLLRGVYTLSGSILWNNDTNINAFSAYTDNRYKTNALKLQTPHAVRTEAIEKQIDEFLSGLHIGTDGAVLIIDPYKSAPAAALLLIKTAFPSRVTYTVKGMRGSGDFTTGESGFSTAHRVPILALYDGKLNKIDVFIEDENTHSVIKKRIRIKLKNHLGSIYHERILKSYKDEKLNDEPDRFFSVSGGHKGATFIIDQNANVRGILNRNPTHYGIFNLKNGRFLFSEKNMKHTTYGLALSVMAHEMDWLGRTHHSYVHKIGFHHYATEHPDGSILALSNSHYNKHVENKIIKLDRETGEELDSLTLDDIFDMTYQNKKQKKRNDWVHINSVEVMDDPDYLIVSLRNIHTIAKINFPKKELVWILSHPDMFKNTEQADKVLTPEGDFDPWFFLQHSADILRDYPNADPSRLYLSFFDNHDDARRPVKWYDGPGTSYGLIVSIDENAGTVRLEKRFPTDYTITRGNTFFDRETNTCFTSDGRLAEPTKKIRGKLCEWDFENGKLLREIIFSKNFFSAHPFIFDFESLSKPLKENRCLIRGELHKPVPFEKNTPLSELPAYPVDKYSFPCKLYGNTFCMWSREHLLSEIIMIGKKHRYHIDYVHTEDGTEITNPFKKVYGYDYFHLFPMNDMKPDEYRICIRYEGTLYQTLVTIEILN